MENRNSSYNRILKSTSIFGGSQVVIILLGIIRTKIIAVLLGPVGIGIIGVFQSVIDMVRSICGLGIDTASIKDIAGANSLGDDYKLNKTVSVFNRWFRFAALFGLVVCVLLCYPISIWAFDSDEFVLPIVLLSVSVFISILTTGRSSILQGMQKISYMAQSSMLGSLLGLVVSVPLYYVWGVDGIIPAFILIYLVSFICVEFYYRKLNIKAVKISNKETFDAGMRILKFSLFIVVAGIVNTVSMFAVRAFLIHNMNESAAGLFQATWTITNVYLGLVLRSMGTDFFPRLSAIADDRYETKKLINEQTYIVLVIASPVIVGILLFSDFILSVLYSSDFSGAKTMLCWQIAGTFLKVLSWPIAFIMLAKNWGKLFLLSEVIFYGVYLAASYLFFPEYGLDAAGIGYLIAYIVYLPVVFFIGRSLSGFMWRRDIVVMFIINLVMIGAAFYISQCLTSNIMLFSIVVLLISLVYAYINLRKVFSMNDLKQWFKRD